MSEDTLMLVMRMDNVCWELKAVDKTGDVSEMFTAMFSRLPSQHGPHAAAAGWRAVAGERRGIITERDIEITELKRQLAEANELLDLYRATAAPILEVAR